MKVKITANYDSTSSPILTVGDALNFPGENIVPDSIAVLIGVGLLTGRMNYSEAQPATIYDWDGAPVFKYHWDFARSVHAEIADDRALLAWMRLTRGRDFEGTLVEFADELVNYGRMYAAATDEVITQVLHFAATVHDTIWDSIGLPKFKQAGIDYMLDAYGAGVPIDDIIA